LSYAFIEYEDPKSAEEAYFKMDNVVIDDRRIHVDFSQYALPDSVFGAHVSLFSVGLFQN